MVTTSFKVRCVELTQKKKQWLQERIVEYARIYNLASRFAPSLPPKYLKDKNPSKLYARWVKGGDGMLQSSILSSSQIQNALQDACANFKTRQALHQENTSISQTTTPNIIKFVNSEYELFRLGDGYGIRVGGKEGIVLPLIVNTQEKEERRRLKGTEWGLRAHLDSGIRMQGDKKERNKVLANKRKANPKAKREKRVKAGLGVITYNLRENTVSIPETIETRKRKKGEKRLIDTIIGVDLGVNNTAVFTAIKIFPDTQKQVQALLNNGVKDVNLKNVHTQILKVKVLKGFQTNDKMKQLRKLENKRRRLRKDVGSRRSDLKELTNHRVSHEISKFASRFPQSIVIFEEGLARLKNPTWSPADVRTKSEYKLKAMGIDTFDIYPAYTSQICSHCGAIGIRTEGTVYFKCTACGLGIGSNPISTIGQYNADVNASVNIALRGLRVLTQIEETVGYVAGSVAEPNVNPDDTARDTTTTGIREAVEGTSVRKAVPPVKVASVTGETKSDAKAEESMKYSTGKMTTYGKTPPRASGSENGFSSCYKGKNNFPGRTESTQKTIISEVLSQSEFRRM